MAKEEFPSHCDRKLLLFLIQATPVHLVSKFYIPGPAETDSVTASVVVSSIVSRESITVVF